MHLTATQAERLRPFVAAWLAPLVPGLEAVKFTVMASGYRGYVSVRDHLGWRRVGSIDDFAGVARALGRL